MARRDRTPPGNRTPSPADFGRRAPDASNGQQRNAAEERAMRELRQTADEHPIDIYPTITGRWRSDALQTSQLPRHRTYDTLLSIMAERVGTDLEDIMLYGRDARPTQLRVEAPINWNDRYAEAHETYMLQMSRMAEPHRTFPSPPPSAYEQALYYIRVKDEEIRRMYGQGVADFRFQYDYDIARQQMRFGIQFSIGRDQTDDPGLRSIAENMFGNNGLSDLEKLHLAADLVEGRPVRAPVVNRDFSFLRPRGETLAAYGGVVDYMLPPDDDFATMVPVPTPARPRLPTRAIKRTMDL